MWGFPNSPYNSIWKDRMKGSDFRQWFDPFFAFVGQNPGCSWEFCSVRRHRVFFWLVQCQVERVQGEKRVRARCWRPDLSCCIVLHFMSMAVRISGTPWEVRSHLPGRWIGTCGKKKRGLGTVASAGVGRALAAECAVEELGFWRGWAPREEPAFRATLLGGDAVLPASRAAPFLRCLPHPRCTLCHCSRGAELTFKPNLVQMCVR